MIRIIRKNGENIEIYLDDNLIVRASYDSIGWAGMDVVESAIVSMAELLNIDVMIE